MINPAWIQLKLRLVEGKEELSFCSLGPRTRQIFSGLRNQGHDDQFGETVTCLNGHFNVTPNRICLKHVFR